jgi:hypothetical protein
MIRIENVEVVGWKHAIRGMRNPHNSWDKSDSYSTHVENEQTLNTAEFEFFVGENDLKRMKNLSLAGTDHRKYMRMIAVYVDITAPLYWWKEYDTYKVGTVANSCSTMHKIQDKEFTLDDFSHEQLNKEELNILDIVMLYLNVNREKFLKTNDKKYWWQMIQLLPSSYNQRRTLMLNYEVLANIYHSRNSHKLDEWREFCEWIKELPYSELITGEEK